MATVSTVQALQSSIGPVDSDSVSTLSVEIGYGNAAGLLFRKGVSGPGPARIEEIDDTPVPSIFSKRQIAAVQPDERHPITSLRSTNDTTSAADEMTEEEKEREAERLFVLFERMEKNPIISASSGIGERQGIKEVMREKMVNGKGDEWDEEERRRMEEENRRDEDEARKEMEAYRRRVGRM